MLRETLRRMRPGYRLYQGPFVSTSDTLIGDPQYGFPCPWLTTYLGKGNRPFAAYHTSADTPDLLSTEGLAACAVAMTGYLLYLANAGAEEVVELVEAETQRSVEQLQEPKRETSAPYLLDDHRASLQQLQRWLTASEKRHLQKQMADGQRQAQEVAKEVAQERPRIAGNRRPGAQRVPRRTAPLSPNPENLSAVMAERIRGSGLPAWALFWANGERTLADIAEAIAGELQKDITLEQVEGFFEAHEELGYVAWKQKKK